MTVISMIPNDTPFLPPKVTEVPKDVLRNFPHSKKVGNYLLGSTLGEGSFAKVKEALHIPTGERVAVKIIDKKKSREDSYVRKNLRREGKILQMIRHHNVVQLLEIMETQNSYYLVTELCRGGDLMDYISQRRKLPEPEVKKYIRQIVSAVDYLHRLGILHRDLKIENLLLDEFKDMKIIDFGLSNCVKVVQTKDGPKVQEFCVTQCGSPAYAAPELLGRKKYGPQVDIWSIGVNMYAMLTGNLPFTVEPFNIKALHSKMTNGQMNPLPDGISRECRDIIKKFLNPDPDKRISVEDTLKHPWIAEGPGIPLNRAPCPNKIKTESLDNSILKHMSENQGFRVGEIIRYVTGNVPSSATAMYHLVLRKLIKHCGNLRASGKIAADHRMLNRTQHVTTTMIRKNDNVSKTGSSQPASHHYSSAARPLVNHTANSVRNTVNTQNKARDHALKTDAAENNNINNNNMYNNDNEAETERQEDTDEAFLDILQTKGTNGAINIPRANSPTKMKKDQNGNRTSVPTHLPSVAGKYVLSNRGKTTGNGITSQPIDNKTDAKKVEKLSATETRDTEEEPFRKRASTFPGKMQRPKLTINRFNKDENDNKERCESVAATHVTKSKHETVQSENAGNMTQINILTNAPSSPKNRRNNVLSQDTPHSSTPRSNGSNVYQNKKQTNGHRRLINVNQIQKVNDKDEELQIGSHNMDELVPTTAKHMLSRASRNNRIQRTRPDNNTLYGTTKEDTMVVEHISEISSSSTRPLSSRNTNISMSSSTRPVTSTLPSLSPQNSDYSKRTS